MPCGRMLIWDRPAQTNYVLTAMEMTKGNVMRVTLTITLLFFALALSGAAQTADESSVIQAERDIVTALTKGDGKTLERLLADDMSLVGSGGWVGTKKDLLKDIKPD